MVRLKTKKLDIAHYDPYARSGAYGLPIDGVLEWMDCREEFLNGCFKCYKIKNGKKYFRRMIKGFYFQTSEVQSVFKLIQYVERKLNLAKGTTIYRCRSNILYIDPDPFWLSQIHRLSFFTVLLRAVYECPHKDPVSQIQTEEYFYNTAVATVSFLSGRTAISKKYQPNPATSWADWFDMSNSIQIPLKQPKRKTDLSFFKSGSCNSKLSKKEIKSFKEWVDEA